MYKVYIDDQPLIYPTVNDEFSLITNPILELETNKFGVFDFTIYPTHPSFDFIKKLKSNVEVYDDEELIFKGRVIDDDLGMYKNRRVISEGELSYLQDSLVRPYNYSGTVQGLLQQFLDSHNQQVEDSKKILLGAIDSTIDPNNYITRSSIEAMSTWKAIDTRLLGLLGGYLRMRYVSENGEKVKYLDYLKDSPYTTVQSIELGKNLLDISKYSRGSDLITGIIAYGAKLKNDEGEDTDIRLDISSVNEGKDYILNTDAVSLYGCIFDVVVFNDVTIPANLKSKAEQYLSSMAVFSNSLKLKVVDLNLIDKDIDKLRFFHYVAIKTSAHDFEDTVLIKKMKIDLFNPQNNIIELESSYTSLTEQNYNTGKLIEQIKMDYITNEAVKKIKDSLTLQMSLIDQKADAVKISVTELETYTGNLGTQISEQSNRLVMLDNKTTQEIADRQTAVNGVKTEVINYTENRIDGFENTYTQRLVDVEGEVTEVQSFFSWDAPSATLSVGKSDMMYVVKISPNRFAIVNQNTGIAQTYIDDEWLNVNKGRFIELVQIGDHYFQSYDDGVVTGTAAYPVGGGS